MGKKWHPIFGHLSPIMGPSRAEALRVIASGIDANMKSPDGEPVLIRAACCGTWDVFKALIDVGAEPLSAGPNGLMSFDYALGGAMKPNRKYWSQRQIRESKRIAQYYVDNGLVGPIAAAAFAIGCNKPTVIKKLLKEGLDPNTSLPDPMRGARAVAVQAFTEIALALTSERVPKIKSANVGELSNEATMLAWAERYGRTKLRDLLIKSAQIQI